MIKRLLLFSFLAISCLSAETKGKVLVFSGSTRENSANKKLALEAAHLAEQEGAMVKLVDLRDFPMPFYDQDLEESKGLPPNAKRLRDMMIGSTAMIIATPEYNGSVSGVLKNTIDWVTRNEQGQPSRDAFKGKKFAIMSASPGSSGGDRALKHLRAMIMDIGGTVVETEVSLPNSYTAFKEDGSLKDAQMQSKLKQEVQQLLH